MLLNVTTSSFLYRENHIFFNLQDSSAKKHKFTTLKSWSEISVLKEEYLFLLGNTNWQTLREYYTTTVATTEYTQSGNSIILAYIPSGKISRALCGGGVGGVRPPPFTLSTITSKVVVYAQAERADTSPYFSSIPLWTLW